jgi:hypothetical protein
MLAKWYNPLVHLPDENKLCVAIFSDVIMRRDTPIMMLIGKIQPRTKESYFMDSHNNTYSLHRIEKYCYAEDLLNEILDRGVV